MSLTPKTVRSGQSFETASTELRKPFVAVVSIHVKPEAVHEFLVILSRVADAVRCEPTLICNVAHQDPEDETKFMLWEMWSDQREFFEVQMLRAYRKYYESRLPELLVEPRVVRIWHPLRADVTFAILNSIQEDSRR